MSRRDLRLLAGAAGLSALGDFLAFLPLVISRAAAHRVRVRGLRAVLRALGAGGRSAPGVAGAIVDRFENRALLVGVSFAQAAIVAAHRR